MKVNASINMTEQVHVIVNMIIKMNATAYLIMKVNKPIKLEIYKESLTLVMGKCL